MPNTTLDPKSCYCELWQTNPQAFLGQGIPEGYCGFCQECGQPGHTRSYPSGVPSSSAWCDEHYNKLAKSLSLASVINAVFWFVPVVLLIFFIWRMFG